MRYVLPFILVLVLFTGGCGSKIVVKIDREMVEAAQQSVAAHASDIDYLQDEGKDGTEKKASNVLPKNAIVEWDKLDVAKGCAIIINNIILNGTDSKTDAEASIPVSVTP